MQKANVFFIWLSFLNRDTGTSLVSFHRFFKDANFEEKKIISLRMKLSELGHLKAVGIFVAKMAESRAHLYLADSEMGSRQLGI